MPPNSKVSVNLTVSVSEVSDNKAKDAVRLIVGSEPGVGQVGVLVITPLSVSLNCSVMPWSAPPPAPKCPTCKELFLVNTDQDWNHNHIRYHVDQRQFLHRSPCLPERPTWLPTEHPSIWFVWNAGTAGRSWLPPLSTNTNTSSTVLSATRNYFVKRKDIVYVFFVLLKIFVILG